MLHDVIDKIYTMKADFMKMTIYIILLNSIFTICPLRAQNLNHTGISEDVIVFHPADVQDIASVRETGGNVTVVRTDSGIVIIDSFISVQAARHARNTVNECFPDAEITCLINTHHHADHINGNPCFHNACIIAHENLLKHADITVIVQIKSDTILNFGNKKFEILYSGAAHTDNDIVVLDREDRVLIMGDLLCFRKCNILGPLSDAVNWIAILEKLIARKEEYDYVVPGHGGIVLTVESLAEQCDYLKSIYSAAGIMMQNNLNFSDLKQKIDLDQYTGYMMAEKIEQDIKTCMNQPAK